MHAGLLATACNDVGLLGQLAVRGFAILFASSKKLLVRLKITDG